MVGPRLVVHGRVTGHGGSSKAAAIDVVRPTVSARRLKRDDDAGDLLCVQRLLKASDEEISLSHHSRITSCACRSVSQITLPSTPGGALLNDLRPLHPLR